MKEKYGILIMCFMMITLLSSCNMMSNSDGMENNHETETIVWKLMFDPATHPSSKYSSDKSINLNFKNSVNCTKPVDYNSEYIKEISGEKVFDALSDIKSYQIDDGLLILATSPEQKVTLTKLDMGGKSVWERDIDVSGYSTTEIIPLNNGSVVFGISDWPNTSLGAPSNAKGYIYCYNQKGDQKWKYSYEDSIGCRIKFICQQKSGDLLCSGLINTGDLSDIVLDVIITKLSINGEFIEEKCFGGRKNEYLEGAVYNDSMELVITGWSLSDDGDFFNGGKGIFKDYVASVNESLSINWAYNPDKSIRYNHKQMQVQDSLITLAGVNMPESNLQGLSANQIVFYNHIIDGKGKLIQANEVVNKSKSINCNACMTNEQKIVFVYDFEEGSKIVIRNLEGEIIKELFCEIRNPIGVIPAKDGGFIVKYNYSLGSLPAPAFISSIWWDMATTLSCYNKDGKLIWQKSYDDYKNNPITDFVYVK